ncbi:hypothetical protein Tco_0636895 [Tanacetum coccineum]
MFMHGHGHPELAKKLNDKIPQTVDEMWERKGQGRSMGTCAPYARREGFTPLTKTLKDILAMDNVNFPPPPSMIEEAVALGRLAHLVKDIRQSGKKNKGSAKGKEKVLNMLEEWKDKFFLIDRRDIPDYLTWRHSCSCVSDDLPTNGYDRNDVERLCARLIRLCEMREEVLIRSGLKMSIYDFMTIPSWSDAKIVEKSHHLPLPLLERVPSHTTAPTPEGAIIPLPTLDEIAAFLPDSRLVKMSKGSSQANRPSKKRKLQKRASEAGSSAPELDQVEGADEADLANLCAEIEDSLKRDEGISMRVVSAPIQHLGKRLGAPHSIAVVSASEPSYVGTSAPASTSGRSLSLGGAVTSGRVRKSRAEVMRRQMDLLDCLARSALACDAEYDQIPDGLFWHRYSWKALDQTITPAELRRTESLLPLELSNREKLNQKKWDVRLLRSEVTSLDDKLEKLQGYYDALGQENRELCYQRDAASEDVKNLQSQLTDAKAASANVLALEKSKSQGYKDAMDGLREEVAQFVGSGVEGVVRKGLRMGCTDVEFEVAVQKLSNFYAGAKADFDKALVDFPTTPFPFLSKIAAASGGTLSDVAQILSDKFVRSATSVSVAPSSVNEAPEQVSP